MNPLIRHQFFVHCMQTAMTASYEAAVVIAKMGREDVSNELVEMYQRLEEIMMQQSAPHPEGVVR